MRVVILAEKPSQARAYADAYEVAKREKTHIELKPCSTFPHGATITWALGHLVRLKTPDEYKEEWKKWDLRNLPLIPNRFEFVVAEDKKAQFNVVKKLFKEADILYNGTDSEREGSNIFYSILNMTGVKNKPIKRLWIRSEEIDVIRKGFDNLQDNSHDLLLYEEARTRQFCDWIVGMNASQLYTLLIQQKGLNTTLNVGRCQSPLIYMIYERQKEIERFVPKPFFELYGHFKNQHGEYQGKAKVKVDSMDELNTLLLEKGLSLNNVIEGKVIEINKEDKKSSSPKLHSLSTLQKVANRKWKYSPAKVLETMQSLYEKKIVSYPRSDCNYISVSEFEYLVNNVEKYMQLINVHFEANKTPRKRYVDDTKVEAHYAIIPTKKIPSIETLNSLSPEEKNIYDEVLRNTLAMFHNDYIYNETRIVTDVKGVLFETVGKIELIKGWKSLFNQQTDKEKEDLEGEKVLPNVSDNEKVLSILISKEGRTTAPKRYTEGDLVDLMKFAGKHVEDEEEREILREVEGIGTEATRSGIIETIKKNGYIEVNKNIVTVSKKGVILCNAIEGTLLSSPSMTAKWEAFLRKIGKGEASSEALISNIKKFISHLIQSAPNSLQNKNIDTAVEQLQASQNLGTCPSCKKGNLINHKAFIGCSEYKNGCKFAINKEILGKKLTDKNIVDLITNGVTSKIKGFKPKDKKPFDAKLKIIDGQVKFEFDNTPGTRKKRIGGLKHGKK